MTATTASPSSGTRPRASALDRTTAMALAATEYRRYLDLLAGLAPADWSRPTDCPDWDVRAMAGHVLGMAEMAASAREAVRQLRAAARRGGDSLDALNALQVEERAGLGPEEVIARLAAAGPRAARSRARRPALLRRLPMPEPQRVGDTTERWTLGFLNDVIWTRDTWMHRVDTTRATGRTMVLTADHDGVLVADIAAEWAGRHRHPCDLRLTGPAGGSWSWGSGGPRLELDAVEFCRILSGRAAGVGLLAVHVPF